MKRVLIPLFLFLFLPGFSHAQSGWYPFTQPWNDSVRSGSAMRFFPAFPLEKSGSKGFLSTNDKGEFIFRDGVPVRFIGINFSFGASMADSAVILRIAPRLAKLGINVVRMHHMDNFNPWNARETLLDLPSPSSDTRRLNPAQVRRLAWTISALSEQGIYANINLHVSRQFQSADGVPGADSLPQYGKAVSIFEPRIRFLMKEYARNLLQSMNPFTGLRFADDPRVAFVEITNENSLYVGWQWGALNHVPGNSNTLSSFHSRMLDSLWTSWLQLRYGSTAGLHAAWDSVSGSPIVNATRNGGFESVPGEEWRLEVHTGNGAAASFTRVTGGVEGLYCGRTTVTASTGTGWHVQLKQVGVRAVERDSLYTVSFRARASHERTIDVGVMRDTVHYDNYGLGRTLRTTTGWQAFSFSFRATQSDSQFTRLTFSLGADTGDVWLDDVRFTPLNQPGVLQDESLDSATVRRIGPDPGDAYTLARLRDTGEFYLSLQKEFFEDMYRYLRDSVGVKCPIAGTNWYGGVGDLYTQSGLDYIDNHAYWQHPRFPNQPWDPSDWVIPNTPMTADTALGTMPRLSAYALFRKPYVVSEYNHPAPNWYQGEMALHLSAYAALQQWNALYFYSYHHGHDAWDHGRINGFFDIDGNPIPLSLLPQMAMIFRTGMIQPAVHEYGLAFAHADMLAENVLPRGNLFFSGLPDALPLVSRVRVERLDAPLTPPASSYGAPDPVGSFLSDTREILWDPSQNRLTLDAPGIQGMTGTISSSPLHMSDVMIEGEDSWGTVIWSSGDGHRLSEQGRSFLTLIGRAENTGMIWDGTTTIHADWGTAPTLLQPLRISLTMHGCDSLRVYPLDSLGRASVSLLGVKDASSKIRLTLDQHVWKTPWFGIERFTSGTTMIDAGSAIPSPLVECFPMPTGGRLNLVISPAGDDALVIEVRDLLGKLVFRENAERTNSRKQFIELNINNLPAGTYVLYLSGAGGIQRKILPLVKL